MTCCDIPVERWMSRRGVKDVVICPECGMGMRYPAPDEKTLGEIYGKGYYDSWGGEQGKDVYWEMKKTLYRMLMELGGVSGENIKLLDVGCATGACLEAAKEKGWQAYGIDVNSYAVETVQKYISGVEVKCSALEEASFEDNFFDVIIMSDVLEHVRNPEECLKKVWGLLKVGGVVVILTPDMDSLSAAMMGKRWMHFKEEHLYYFSKKAIRGLLGSIGFEVQKLKMFCKPLTLRYAATQFRKYPMPVISPLMSLADKFLPDGLCRKIFWVPMGEMVVCARKKAAI